MAVGKHGQRLNKSGQFWIQERFDRNTGILDFDETVDCFEENIGYPNGDIHSDLKYSSSAEECQQMCQANDNCLYWGFKRGKICWLKNKKISSSSSSGTISGPKNCQEIYQDVNSAAIQYPKDMRSKIFTSKALQILGEKKISHEIFTRVLPKLKRSELSLHYQCGSKDKDSLVEVI